MQIHAQRLGPAGATGLLDADPVPVTVYGRYLLRGARVTVSARPYPR